MARGLPLAKPQQYGVLARGLIMQALAHREGVSQFLELVIAPGAGVACGPGDNPVPSKKNIVLNWRQDKGLRDPLESALRVAFPGAEVIWRALDVIAPADMVGYYPVIGELGYFLRRTTQQIIGQDDYQGVAIFMDGDKRIVVDDGTQPAADVKTIEFDDLLSPPTWIDLRVIQLKVVMRGDLTFGTKIRLPSTWINTSQSGAPTGGYQDQGALLKGDFSVQSLRHIGSSRSPSGDGWVSVIEATALANLPPPEPVSCPKPKEGGQ